MIREAATELDPGWGELLDVDVLESGDWIGLFRSENALYVRTPRRSMPAPLGIRFPLIRALDRDRCVLVDSRTDRAHHNGWVLSLPRSETRSFVAGDGIQDVLATSDAIVITYFDEGVFSGIAPSNEGVAIFTDEGQLRAGYLSLFGPKAADVADCYAACWESDSRIAFLPYTGFPLVRLDLRTLDQQVAPTPRRLHGASAISISGETVLVYGPYDKKKTMYSWTPGREPSAIGRHPGPLRGLRNGRFLAREPSGFTVMETVLASR
jgi:hypothetical protein